VLPLIALLHVFPCHFQSLQQGKEPAGPGGRAGWDSCL
jgi:hypothetical protein